jgi:hypothetical protein
MIDFDQLWSRYDWRPIRNCPGRFVLRGWTNLRPEDLCEGAVESLLFVPQAAPDPVLVTQLESGGLISYLKNEKRLLHTLNTEEGFARKLEQLGIALVAQKNNGV